MRKYEYIEDCKVEYVKCVLSGAREHARDQDLWERGIRALFELSKKQGHDTFTEIQKSTKFLELALPRVFELDCRSSLR